ncbi:TraR/DksA family transcriptional regulator [Rhodopseudomonas palustris]|nr:TraR/DksA family transcriptional regulator [Rhodopseudomonas palustris]
MDQFDEAQALEERERDECIARATARRKGPGATHCVVCGEPIDEARREAMPSAIRCVECQDRRERWARVHRGR